MIKTFLIATLLSTLCSQSLAQKAYTYSYDKNESIESCIKAMKKFANANKFKLIKNNEAGKYEYSLQDAAREAVGQAYYVDGSCHIYQY